MKKLNVYYIVSIISLVFMMFILFRTLQVTGWFEAHQEKLPAEQVFEKYTGDYLLFLDQESQIEKHIQVEGFRSENEIKTLLILLDSLPRYSIEISDFENEQVLMVAYGLDSTGASQRLEGCELLLTGDSLENFAGSTIGDFCGLNQESTEYLAVDLLLSGPEVSLEIQSRKFGQTDSLDSKKYLLKRIDHGRE